MTRGEYSLIDSGVSDIWLPVNACQAFEGAFGLVFDNSTSLYLINGSVHTRLQQINPTVTFKLGISTFGGPTVDITLPYGAFDLEASSPLYPNATKYFPIRRATNAAQITLGRTFLQEAYIVVDYERKNFSVNQAVFQEQNVQKLTAIRSATKSPSDGDASDSTGRESGPSAHSLSHSALAGIIAGPVISILLLVSLTTYICWKRGRCRAKAAGRKLARVSSPSEVKNAIEEEHGDFTTSELTSQCVDIYPQELTATESRVRNELGGTGIVHELGSSQFELPATVRPAKPRDNNGPLAT